MASGTPCVIYARVSTKEQAEEGYSIPAQLKAIRAFCADEKLSPVAEFIESESAGHAGRTEFGRMLAYFATHPECRTVVAHKLDRLYRNFADQIALEETLEVRARYVLGDVADTPQGELVRDVQLSVAKYYLGNLREEVKKGMEEKVAQGGWPHRAPLGYRNDKLARTVVKDPLTSPLLAWAFERYESGTISVPDLAAELEARGLTSKNGKRLSVSGLHKALSNPFYCGRILYKGTLFAGAHEPLVSVALFEAVQDALAGNRNGTKVRKPEYPLRGLMRCSECGCIITAGTHKDHVYYRCTHGKGKGSCSQKKYIREEVLTAEVEELLGSIELNEEVMARLVSDCEAYLEEKRAEVDEGNGAARAQIATLKNKEARLLDAFLEGDVPAEVYRERAESLAASRRGLELRVAEGSHEGLRTIEQVRELAACAASARVTFATSAGAEQRNVLSNVLCNLGVAGGHIASYQWKGPFEFLERSPEGAYIHQWWAIEDLNL